MRVERVVAHAFGPFAGEHLDLAPGLTVIAGPNEAGKSSWHAALQAALCGLRRARGRGTAAEAEFEARHRPWDAPERWEVEARLALDDGRSIEIAQDLAGKVACRAVDVGLGRDVSDEIMDGTPDASRWLGLGRDAFASTICVSQAHILAIADPQTADALQDHMQRAAATRGTDATAAEARERIERFRREHVGLDRVNARGPLRSARLACEASGARLADAREQHAAYLDATAAAEEAERRAAHAGRRVTAIEAALAAQAAAVTTRRAQRADELAQRNPTAPERLLERDSLADLVVRAVEGWERRPRLELPVGRSSAELERELAALPGPPAGDTQVHPTVGVARRRLELSREALELSREAMEALGSRPTIGVRDGVPAHVDEHLVRDLIRRMRTPDPAPEPALEQELAAARAGGGPRPPRALIPIAIAGIVGVAAVVLSLLGQPLISLVAVLGTLVLGGLALAAWRRAGVGAGRVDIDRLARAEAAMAPVRAAREFAVRERIEAVAMASSAGLPTQPEVLDEIADQIASESRLRADLERWESRHADLTDRHHEAARDLAQALLARGLDPAQFGSPEQAASAYEVACHERGRQLALAARADGLRDALAAQLGIEAAHDKGAALIAAAAEALKAAAAAASIHVEDADPEMLVARLSAWRTRRRAELEASELALREWEELSSLLDGGTLRDLAAEAARQSERAADLAGRAPGADLGRLVARSDLESLLAVERDEQSRAQRDADGRAGALAQMRGSLPDVAEAEEADAEARAEMARVASLADVLDETLRLLRASEERVHRNLAPVLAAAIRRWLPVVSRGAYTDAGVDPADLAVTVKEAATGRWRPALLLSEGTREQIYLLLRVAMAQHLVTTEETAPLILDEVTAQADSERAIALLEVLHQLSAERQVILFTHDRTVVEWAERALDAERDAVIRLPLRAGALVTVSG